MFHSKWPQFREESWQMGRGWDILCCFPETLCEMRCCEAWDCVLKISRMNEIVWIQPWGMFIRTLMTFIMPVWKGIFSTHMALKIQFYMLPSNQYPHSAKSLRCLNVCPFSLRKKIHIKHQMANTWSVLMTFEYCNLPSRSKTCQKKLFGVNVQVDIHWPSQSSRKLNIAIRAGFTIQILTFPKLIQKLVFFIWKIQGGNFYAPILDFKEKWIIVSMAKWQWSEV